MLTLTNISTNKLIAQDARLLTGRLWNKHLRRPCLRNMDTAALHEKRTLTEMIAHNTNTYTLI